ncbi:ABC transporter ATP-binding protein [Salinibacterium hongtaonis]|uniref:ABC transporter ATP-binding protein n=1 Tax=Homoserinimonas hongtaonis TaxID=2079791 RepID=UPI001F547CB6|nr:ABC transporter ATP-binding protein [Salinibacterium hongtaonis]
MIEARDISFGYGNSTRILEGWSATFSAGEVVAVTGPSGRGKSTLLYILGLMLRPDGGEVRVDGRHVSALNDRTRAGLRSSLFGFVFQDAALDPTRTVLDNVIEPALYRGDSRRDSQERAKELMSRFGVEFRADARPGQVSGGQAQRIALCRALINDPPILLADEPTGNLDPISSALVVDAFQDKARSGAAVIVVTHDPELVSRCDRRIDL